MSKLESTALIRQPLFRQLSATPGLYWLGQTPITSKAIRRCARRCSAPSSRRVQCLCAAIGFEALRSAIVTDLGTPGAEALVTEGGVQCAGDDLPRAVQARTTLVTTDPPGNGRACSRASRAPR